MTRGTQPPWDAPVDRDPAWARARDPRGILCGVLYVGVEPRVLVELLLDGARNDGRLVALHAAMGPRLFWGRAEGPWVPWDDRLRDPKADCEVWERPWPWCYGDEVWIAAVVAGALPVLIHFLDDAEGQLFAVAPRANLSDPELAELARLWGERDAGRHLRQLFPKPAT